MVIAAFRSEATGKILEETTMAESASIMELHAMLVDACKGYDDGILAAEKPHLKALFEKAKSAHEKAHAEVHAILSIMAANPDYESSFLTPVHKVTFSTRAAGMGPVESFLSSFVSGEGGIVEAYNKAIYANDDDGPVCDVLQRQKSLFVKFAGELQRATKP
jgi:Domain of unknown function (DUF2383)